MRTGARFAVILAAALSLLLVSLQGCRRSTTGGSRPPALAVQTPGDQNIALGSTLAFKVTVLGGDKDTVLSAMPAPLPANARFDQGTGDFSFAPDENQIQPFTFSFTATSGGLSATSSVKVTVTEEPATNQTRVAGRVLEAGSQDPIPNVPITVVGKMITVQTDAQGNFEVDLPSDSTALLFDGFNATPPSTFASVAEDMDLVLGHPLYPGQRNVLPRPVYLPRLGTPSGTITQGQPASIENTQLGVKLEVAAGAARRPDNTPFTGDVYLLEVPPARTPAALPDDLQPGRVFAIQPAGILFNPPAQMTWPNIDMLPQGSLTSLWAVSPTTGRFVVVGQGRADGNGNIVTASGGIPSASWNFPLPQAPNGDSNNDSNNDDNQLPDGDDCGGSKASTTVGSEASLQTGNLSVAHQTVTYRSLSQDRGVRVVYNSCCADPTPLINLDLFTSPGVATPAAFSTNFTIAGNNRGFDTFIAGTNQRLRHATQFDARSLPTGRYPYEVRTTSHYESSAVSARFTGQALVNNEVRSPIGAGWSLSGLQCLHFPANQPDVVLTEGNGAIRAFVPQNRGGGGAKTDIAFVMDGSGSIGNTDWRLQLEGFAGAVEDPGIVPHDGSVKITVVQFAGNSGFVEVPLTQITSQQVADQVAAALRAISQRGGGTPMAEGVNTAAQEIGTGTPGARQVMCVSTDGSPNNQQAALLAAQNAIQAGIDQIDAIAVGPGANVSFLRTFVQNGTVYTAATFAAFAQTIGIKLKLVIAGSPAGEFSVLFREQDGTYTREYPDGKAVTFNASGFQTSAVDRNGNTSVYTYDGQNRLQTMRDPLGKTTTFSYGPGGLLSAITDPAGRSTQFRHDANRDLVQIIDPDNTTRQFEYDARHRMEAQVDKRGFRTEYRYGAAGRLTETEHIATGQIRKVIASQSRAAVMNPQSTTKMSPAPGVLAATLTSEYENPAGDKTVYQTDRFGTITSVEDPLSRSTTIQRNSSGLPILITRPDGSVSSMTYDIRGNLLEVTDNPNGDVQVTKMTYDPDFSQVTSIIDAAGNINPQTMVTYKFEYDAAGNLTKTIDVKGTVSEFRYDEAGLGVPGITGLLTTRVDAVGLPEQRTTTFAYDPATGNVARITDPVGRVTNFTYDSAGREEVREFQGSDTDPNTKQTWRYAFDALNRVRTVTNPRGAVVTNTYDAAGNLRSVTDPKTTNPGTITFDYDDRNRLMTRTDALGEKEVYEYDDLDRLTTLTDRKGQIFSYTYDKGDRLVAEEYPGMKGAVNNRTVSYGYDPVDNLISAISPDARLTYAYDRYSRMRTATTDQSQITYTYDKNDNRRSMAVQWGAQTLRVFNYSYDELNRLTTLSDSASNTTTFGYDALSRRTMITFPNGVVTSVAYNAASEGEMIDTPGVSRFVYGYTPFGNRGVSTLDRPALNLPNATASYGYDDENQLLTVNHSAIPMQVFTYDLAGNRLTEQGSAVAWRYNAANQLLENGAYRFTYDENGNQATKVDKTTSATTTYGWDPKDRLISVSDPTNLVSVTNVYDALGRRVRKSVTGMTTSVTQWVYDGDNLLLEIDGSGSQSTVTAIHGYGSSLDDVLYVSRGGAAYAYHRDGQGSVTEITDANRQVVNAYLYDSFGNLVASNETVPNRLLFAARPFDRNSGLYNIRARYYDPEIGRWVSEDPIGLDGGDANLFRQSSNNLSRYRDNTGFAYHIAARVGGGAALGGISNLIWQLNNNGWRLGCVEFRDVGKAALIGAGLGGAGGFLTKSAGYLRMLSGRLLSRIKNATGGWSQWIRVGPSFSTSGQFSTKLSIKWGASPTKGMKYVNMIGNKVLRSFNQWLRKRKLPGNSWRTRDPGHFHIKR